VAALDWENLAEENELKNHLRVLLAHLPKWQHQPTKRSVSWFTTIANQ